ncbi:MAG: IS1634 family transposase [Planctomycetes bacterium]|nr:IS1634 family transposase [Planctomycetota bacterium]
MYLRHTTVTKNGRRHVHWRLVRSIRFGSKVRQEVVAHLGELDADGRARAAALAEQFVGRRRPAERDLFEPANAARATPSKVLLEKVRVERARSFGEVWLAWKLWQALGLDGFCRARLAVGREQVPWWDVAAILVIARLCEPSSELHIAEDWYRRTALEDILGVPAELVHHTRLYQGLDRLLPHQRALEAHLKECYGELFGITYDLLLYDVTSTYFEGDAKGNPQAQRGHSRDQRPDCKQVCIGLVVTREGFPLGYQVFAGNRTDVTTVEEVVTNMEARFGKASRVWVMDRGMVSEANLQWLRAGNRKYVIGAARSELRKWARELRDKTGWAQVRDGLDVKLCPGPEGEEVFILCRSAARKEKEVAMHERFSERIVTGLESLSRRLASAKKTVDSGQVQRQIGRLLQSNRRAAARFDVTVATDDKSPSGLRVTWQRNRKWQAWNRASEGCYVLRSNVTDWSPDELWRTYIQLHEAESAFRIQKSDLQIRPIWHQREDRVQAHILVCYLAFALWKSCRAGKPVLGSARARGPCSKNSGEWLRSTSSSRWRTTARCGCAACPNPTPIPPRFSSASGWKSPSG